jgi:deazaflavin-dependent oxidoreductase (nitroreductase family)
MSEYRPYPREQPRNPLIQGKTTVLGVSMHGGRVLSAMQLPLFTLVPPQGFGVLTTTGRRTGRTRRKCVRAIRRGEKVYIVSIGGMRAAWMKNIQADPNVMVRVRGGTFRGRARELGDSADAELAMTAYCGTVNAFDYAECALWRKGRPTRAKIKDLHEGWFREGVPLVIELEPSKRRDPSKRRS